jgi:protein-tyrosine phosphatase
MNIQKADGTNAEYNVADIDSVWFQEIEECDIESEYVRAFLDNVDYSADTTYTVSHILDTIIVNGEKQKELVYYKKGTGQDKPEPVVISWEGTAAKIIMSTLADFTILPDAQRMAAPAEISVSTSPQKVYNLIPGVKYYYKVLDANSNVIKAGCIRPVGPLRMIKISSFTNVRDMGGWNIVGGGHMAYGRLYRGAKISSSISTDAKNVFLHDLNISLDLDLRGIKDSEKEEKYIIKEADYIRYPVEKNLGRGTGNTQELYQQAIRTVIQYLSQGKNVYFHCAGGADRTGTLAFLIEALVGVTESDMSKDYELTTFDSSNKRARNFRATEDETHILYETITHLRKFGDPQKETIQELAVKWATTRHSESVDPLTMDEINILRQCLVIK